MTAHTKVEPSAGATAAPKPLSTGDTTDYAAVRSQAIKAGEEESFVRLQEACSLLKLKCTSLGPENFFVAILPDPVHSHLALSFDRRIEVIQEAMQDEGYDYIRSILPWDNRTHPESDDLEERLKPLWFQEGREHIPGWLYFRDPSAKELFIFVVGETPTTGINRKQFETAINLIERFTANNLKSCRKAPCLRILGPNYSGSLASLDGLLRSEVPDVPTSIHSGSISGEEQIKDFLSSKPQEKHFVTFQESDSIVIQRFIEYLQGDEYGFANYKAHTDDKNPWIAVVSEDETAYGKGNAFKVKPPLLEVHFPREISQLRSAYQKEVEATTNTGSSGPRDELPFYSDVTGDDSVPEYSSRQRVLSQEAVMQGVVSELRRHRIDYVLVRASDPMDTLFVSRYIRNAYHEGRVVTIGADVLFRREAEDQVLQGLLSLSTYSVAPTSSHGFKLYEDTHLERMFASSDDAGMYNAMRSLNSAWVTDDSNALKPADGKTTIPMLFQYGWLLEAGGAAWTRSYMAPPVRLSVLGRDEYWPLAVLGPLPNDNSRLPKVDGQANSSLNQLDLPVSWRAVQLLAIVLALGFCFSILWASIFSHWQRTALFAPAAADGRTRAIAIAASVFCFIDALLLWPSFRSDNWRLVDWALLAFAFLTAITAGIHLRLRAMCIADAIAEVASPTPHTKEQEDALVALRWGKMACWIWLTFLLLALAGSAWYILQTESLSSHMALLGRFAILRATRLNSGVSFIMPVLFFLGVWLWWANAVIGGYALLDDRRTRLPKGMKHGSLEALDRSHKAVQETIHPGPRPYAICALCILIAAIVCAVLVQWSHLSLERMDRAYLLTATFGLAMAGIFGATLRLWQIWLEVRRLLDALDSMPLRDGFKAIEGFKWKPIWRLGAGTMAEFQRLLAREREALTRVGNSLPKLQRQSADLNDYLEKARASLQEARAYEDTPQLTARIGALSQSDFAAALDIGQKELLQARAVRRFGAYQRKIAELAGCVLDRLAAKWVDMKDVEEVRKNPHYRACEQFVCLVYVNFLMAMITRIRTLIVAIGGMYVLVLIGVNQYPFEPKAALQLLMVLLLIYIVAVVATVFGQIHRDTTLSHLTDTEPGELGSDFWIRMASFVALPLFTLFTSQFPSVSRFFYSWIQPAIEGLNH